MALPFGGFGYGRWRLASGLHRHGNGITRVGGALFRRGAAGLAAGAWTLVINWLPVIVGPGQIGI